MSTGVSSKCLSLGSPKDLSSLVDLGGGESLPRWVGRQDWEGTRGGAVIQIATVGSGS